jgi:hypothetical protein
MFLKTMLSIVTITFLLLANMTLSEELVSGKILRRERRLLVFASGTVLQVGSVYSFVHFSRHVSALVGASILSQMLLGMS